MNTTQAEQDHNYDVVVIGSGPGGYATALRAAQLGLDVAIVEKDNVLGGVCLNRGCVPSKALITAARSIAQTQSAARMGIKASIESIDFGKLADYQHDAVTTMTDGLASLLKARSISVFHGIGSLRHDGGHKDAKYRHIVEVYETESLQSIELHSRHVVLATGSRPRPLPGVPFGGQLIDSTQALELKPFPKRAIVIGAGAVAVEFASMWNEAGVNVTMLIRKDRVLSDWHRRTSSALTRALKRSGVTVVTHANVSHATTDEAAGSITVSYIGADGEPHEANADVALAAIGRDPVTDFDWLQPSGIGTDGNGFIDTDAYGRTTTDGIWAVGDVTHGPSLAYRAFGQGMVIAESIAGLNPEPIDDTTVPSVVFSSPEAASVGLTVEQAKADDNFINPHESVYPMMGNARMHMSGEPGSMALVTGAYADNPNTSVVLGAHMVAPEASDMVAEAQELIGNRVPLSEAARLIHPHPTFSETFGEALLKADGRPLHTM